MFPRDMRAGSVPLQVVPCAIVTSRISVTSDRQKQSLPVLD